MELKGCFNRTHEKAEAFAKKASSPIEVYKELDDVFADKEIDIVDALLPVQFNPDVIKRAIEAEKHIVIEKPIAATLDQAKQIVKMANDHPELVIAVSEHWCFLKSIEAIKSAMKDIGKVVGFNYQSTGPFNWNNKYLTTSWRKNPEHIGGFLSDGGVHQLALLTGVLGHVSEVNARTVQVRPESGDEDIMWALLKMESGLIGTFNYGSSLGNKDKTGWFEVLGDNGSIYYDFSAKGEGNRLVVKKGGNSPDSPYSETETIIENENWGVQREFDVLAEVLDGKKDRTELCSPARAFHHLAIVAAILESSHSDAKTVKTPGWE